MHCVNMNMLLSGLQGMGKIPKEHLLLWSRTREKYNEAIQSQRIWARNGYNPGKGLNEYAEKICLLARWIPCFTILHRINLAQSNITKVSQFLWDPEDITKPIGTFIKVGPSPHALLYWPFMLSVVNQPATPTLLGSFVLCPRHFLC